MKRWSLLAAVLVLAAGTLAASAESYKVDPVHSSVVYRIRHNDVSFFYGRLNAPDGTIEYDATKPEATKLSFSLKTANLDTGNAQRDAHIKGPEYFNATDFPTMTFTSSAVKKLEDNKLEVTGEIKIHGKIKQITLPVEITGVKPTLVGMEATFTIKRSDFGIGPAGGNVLGDDVRLTVAFEGKK